MVAKGRNRFLYLVSLSLLLFISVASNLREYLRFPTLQWTSLDTERESIPLSTPDDGNASARSEETPLRSRSKALKDNSLEGRTRICRQISVNLTQPHLIPEPIPYTCEGKVYDEFGTNLLTYAAKMNERDPAWGRRPYPIPSNKTVLIFGNSHTKQTAVALWCQYSDKLRYARKIKNALVPTSYEVSFENDSRLFIITNTPIVYSPKWATLLEKELQYPVASLDAIVVGMFNPHVPTSNSKFALDMLNFSKHIEDVDIEKHPPPNPMDVARIFRGPILILSSYYQKFENRSRENGKKDLQRLEQEYGRTNAVFVDGRKHIRDLDECGAEIRVNSPCFRNNDPYNGTTDPGNMHRCIGINGGHPDLTAWDVIEALYKLL